MLEVADVFRRYGDAYLQRFGHWGTRKALSPIVRDGNAPVQARRARRRIGTRTRHSPHQTHPVEGRAQRAYVAHT